jgi:hypothetical protein
LQAAGHAGDLPSAAARPAVALYCDRAAAAGNRFRLENANAAAVVSLCRELEGLPLAIELAAACASSLPAANLVMRLPSMRLDVLRGARYDAPARHHDIRAAIGWTVRKDRMAQNMDIFDFEITPDQMAAIATMDTGASLFFDHRDPEAAIRLGSRTID